MTTSPDVTYMTVAQGRVSVLVLILTILALILYLVWLTVKLNRLRILTATLAYQAIPLCQAQNLDDQTPSVVCHNVWLSIVFAIITIIGIALWFCKYVRRNSFFKGYKFKRTLDLYLIICDNLRFVPIKIRSISGHFYKLHVNKFDEISETQLRLEKHLLWDTLTIDWKNIKLKYASEKVSLPSSVVIPISDKFRLRHLTELPFDCFLMVKQGSEWKDLRYDIMIEKPDCNDMV